MRSGMAGKDVAVMLGASSAALICNWIRVAEDSSPRSGGQEPRRTHEGFRGQSARTVGEGCCNISLGTSGTIFISSESFKVDCNNALHSFDHAVRTIRRICCTTNAPKSVRQYREGLPERNNQRKGGNGT